MRKRLLFIALLTAIVTVGYADTWTVAGSKDALYGDEDWSTTNVDNDMLSGDGVNYVLTVTDCTLEQGVKYQFKIVKDHAWDESYPSDNKTFQVTETATYTIVYSFNATTHEVGVTTTKTGNAGEIMHTYTVAGSSIDLFGVEWDPTAVINDMQKESNGVYYWRKKNITSVENFEFKVCVDHAWGVSYPAANYAVYKPDIEGLKEGPYDIELEFNEDTKVVFGRIIEYAEIYEFTIYPNIGFEKGPNEGNVYKGTINLSNTLEDKEFKFKVTEIGYSVNHTLGIGEVALIDDENLIDATGNQGDDFVIKNSTSGYQTYSVTATWTPNPSSANNWTVKIEGKDSRVLKYYLVGDLTGGWPEDGDNMDVEMTRLDNGLYTYEVPNFVAVANTTYYYKLRANKIWGLYDLPITGNNNWTPAQSGVYNLKFMANVTGEEINGIPPYTLTVDAEEIEITSYYLVGGTDSWEVGETLVKSGNVYSIVLPYLPGYSFAIAPNTIINGSNQIENWNLIIRPEVQQEVAFKNTSGKLSSIDNSQNWSMRRLNANESSEYMVTFVLNEETMSWKIECSTSIAISDVGYATYSNAQPYKIEGDDVEVYTISEVNTTAQFNKLPDNASLPARTGVILKGAGEVTISPSDGTTEIGTNYLIGSGDYTYDITNYGYKAYIFANGSKGVGFYVLDMDSNDKTLPAHKAFLAAPTNSNAPFFGLDSDDATWLRSMGNESVNKITYYTLDGRRVLKPSKGVYIVNGKKIVKR